MLPTIALRPSALTPPSASGASSHSRQGDRVAGWLGGSQAGRQPIPNHCERCKRCEARQTLWSPRLVSLAAAHLLTSCLCRTLLAGECHAPLPLTANRPFLTSDEAVAMFMCTLQNNWPRLGAQLALPGQLHLTALHTYFTLFSVFSVFSRCFQCCFSVGKLPKSISRICVVALGINGFSFRPPKKIVINFRRRHRPPMSTRGDPLDPMSILALSNWFCHLIAYIQAH